jgi:hypothetical protein
MKPFGQMTFGQRFALTVVICLAILFALAAYGYFSGRWEDDENNAHLWGLAAAESRPELCMDDETRERVRKLFLDALDLAFKEKVEKLYEIWLSDPTGQPARAAKGADSALRAYSQARAAAMKFNPPECFAYPK